MKRRNFILGLGTIAAGAGTAMGTGAFSSLSADRGVSATVANEDGAYLAMEPVPNTPNNGFTQPDNDTAQVAFDFNGDASVDGTSVDGSGVATDSVYDFDSVFQVTNQGTQTVFLQAPVELVDTTLNDVYIYAGTNRSTRLDGSAAVAELSVGDTVVLGFHIDATDAQLSGTSEDSLTAHLEASDSHSANTVLDSGD